MGLLDTVKDVAVMVQKADNIQLNQKILELQAQVMDVLDENYRLKEEARRLRDAAAFKGTLVFKGGHYVRQVDGVEEAYCSGCWDADGKAIRLQHQGEGWGLWCPGCERAAPGTATNY